MAQYFSESHEGMSSLPTNSHGGMLMRHRCAIVFAVGATLAAKDQLVLGVLPAGYTIDEITADSDGIAGLSVNVVQAEGLAQSDAKTTLASAISLAAAGGAFPIRRLDHPGCKYVHHGRAGGVVLIFVFPVAFALGRATPDWRFLLRRVVRGRRGAFGRLGFKL